MTDDIQHIRIEDYDYPLPDERIAKFPLAERDSSKLLVYRNGTVSDDSFKSLPHYLPKGALMVFNNTRVIQARLHFRKETGALIEVFCLEPLLPKEYVLTVVYILFFGKVDMEDSMAALTILNAIIH